MVIVQHEVHSLYCHPGCCRAIHRTGLSQHIKETSFRDLGSNTSELGHRKCYIDRCQIVSRQIRSGDETWISQLWHSSTSRKFCFIVWQVRRFVVFLITTNEYCILRRNVNEVHVQRFRHRPITYQNKVLMFQSIT